MLRQNQVFSHWEFTNYLLSKLFSDKTEVPAISRSFSFYCLSCLVVGLVWNSDVVLSPCTISCCVITVNHRDRTPKHDSVPTFVLVWKRRIVTATNQRKIAARNIIEILQFLKDLASSGEPGMVRPCFYVLQLWTRFSNCHKQHPWPRLQEHIDPSHL